MNSMHFLISSLFDMYIMVVLLRLWLQASKTDFYNPLSQFVVKATHPIVTPLRRVIPPIGNIDMATLFLAYVLSFAKISLLVIASTGSVEEINLSLLFIALISLVKAFGGLLFWVLILRSILSWVSKGSNPIEHVFQQLTEPMLAPIRRVIPAMGGLDLSVLVVFLLLQFINIFIGDLIGPIWFQL